MTEQEKKVLQSSGLFDGVADLERMLTCLNAETADYERNGILWHMGDSIQACAVILSGAVRAETVNASGTHTLTAYHRPGALVGDVLMATPGGVSPVYVIAAEPTRVLFLPYGRIMGGCSRCCAAHVRLRENLLSEIAQKYWAQRRRMACLSESSLRVRITMFLLDHSRGSSAFTLGMTRENLADYLCVNRSALSRELSRMKQEGLIDFNRDRFTIPRADSLTALLP